jgi:hypothetical protein
MLPGAQKATFAVLRIKDSCGAQPPHNGFPAES